VVLDSSFELREYSDATLNDPSMPFLVEAGLAGLITEKVRLVIKGGYENTFLSSSAACESTGCTNFSGPVAQIEAGWDPSETASATLGFTRTVQPVSGNYGWYDDWRGYLNGKLLLGGRFALTANANLDVIDFANSGRQDTQASVEGAIDVEVFRMFHTALGTVLTTRDSSLGGVFTYQRAEVYVRLNFTY